MKIHYSPCFDGEHYIDFTGRKNLLVDEMVVGNSGLLNELELRGGLACECLSESERQANYYNAVKKLAETENGNIISESFKADEYGVASELLKWRDELLVAGWNPDIRGISGKLDLLSDIERCLAKEGINVKGESDRWKAVLGSEILPLNSNDEIIVHYPEKHLTPFIAELLRRLREVGVKSTFMIPDKSIAAEGTNLKKIQQALLTNASGVLDEDDDESFRIVRFDRQVSALEWVVKNEYSQGSVFINSDNRSFDNIQMLYGNPLSGSALKDANPEIVQLFKLGCSLFLRPLNVYNLLSYLQISRHPVPFALRRDLSDVIISEGGIVNAEWKKVIADYFENLEKSKKDKKKDFMVFLPVEFTNDSGIGIVKLKEYVKALRSWASQTLIIIFEDSAAINDILVIKQLTVLVNFCNALMIILNGQNTETISNEKLKSWILSIYKPLNYPNGDARAGSRYVVESPAAFVDEAEEVTWIDCYNGMPKASVHKFLSKFEKDALIKHGLLLWNEEDQVKAQLFEQMMAILNCRSKLTLVVSDKEKGEKPAMHPVMIQLSALFENLSVAEKTNAVPEGESNEITKINLPSPQIMIDTGTQNQFTPREKESYSSISELIQNPLDYVLNYQAGLSHSSVMELSNENRTMGNVAHQFIQNLVDESEKKLEVMKAVMENDFSNKFDRAVLQKGAILLLDENRIQLKRFAEQLRQSVNSLLAIIEQNRLKICGCEVISACTFDRLFDMEARMDMLLCDKSSSYVIFDMKWSSGNTHIRQLEENRALQLEVYKAVLKKAEPDKTVSTVAYFILTSGMLLTTGNLTGQNVKVITPENGDDIFKLAVNSYSYRWEQLQEGIIEAAEKLPLVNLDYHNDSVEKGLYPLEADYNDKDLKAENGFSKFKTFKGGLR